MDANEAGTIARKYFETTLNTTSFTMETIKNEESKPLGVSIGVWMLEVLLKPYYGPEKKFIFEISMGDKKIISVKQKDNSSPFFSFP